MNKIIVLKVEMSYGNVKDYIYPAVLCDEDNLVLVDCGYVGALSKIEEALLYNGLSPEKITHIILTHHDHDHVGAAAAFQQKYPHVMILASAKEAPYISRERKSLRLEQAEQLQKELPEDQRLFGEFFCNLLRSVEPVQIDRILQEDELLPFCGGCLILATPGYTPGHISLYLAESDTIISGDAMALEQGQPVLPNPQYTLDMNQARISMERLLSHPAQTILCYHGGLFKNRKC